MTYTAQALCVFAVGVALVLGGCASPASQPLRQLVEQGTVLRGVTVVDTHDGTLWRDMAIVIHGPRIAAVLPDRQVDVGSGAMTIDGRGRYVVPGYLDMHVHTLPMAAQGQAPWSMLVAHGVTGVREMAGSLSFAREARALNAERAAGRLLAPEIVQIPGDLMLGVTSPALARVMVREQKEAGVDFVKVISTDRDTMLATLDAARQHGLTVAGHLSPLAFTAQEAAAAGWHAVEHLGAGMGMLLECSHRAEDVRAAVARGEGARPGLEPLSVVSPLLFRGLDAPLFQRVMDTVDESRCDAMVRATVAAGLWQVPTLIRLRTMAFSAHARHRASRELAYVDKTRRALWEQLAQRYEQTVPRAAAASFEQFYAAQQGLLRRLHRHGAKLMAGSDLGGIWVVPGVGLHEEFAELAQAGLSPLAVLQSTTLNPARFLNREATLGSVAAGKQADLVLLNANPLANVANLSAIAGVVLNGRYLARDELDAMKQRVRVAYEQAIVGDMASVIDPGHMH